MHAVQRSSTFFVARRAIIVRNHWKKTTGSAVYVPLCSKAAADQAASQFFVNLIKLAFLKPLQLRKILPRTEYNKRRPWLEAAQNCTMKLIVAAVSDRANTVYCIKLYLGSTSHAIVMQPTLAHNSSIFIVAARGIPQTVVITIQEGLFKSITLNILQENWTTTTAKGGKARSIACTK